MKRLDAPSRALLAAAFSIAASAAFPETLTPSRLAELTARGNPSLVAARLAEREAEGRLLSSRGAGLPSLSVDARASWAANPAEAVTIPAGSFGSLPVPSPASPTRLPSTDVTIADAQDPVSWSAAASLDQPLWTWGKLSGAVDAREGEALLARVASQRAEASALADLYRSLYALSYQREALAVADDQADLSSRMLDSVSASRAAGTLTDLDYEDAALNAERILRSRATLEDSVARLERSVLLIAGIDPSARATGEGYGISLEGLAEYPVMPKVNAADWTARALSGNLDLAYARRGADARVSAAELARRQAAGKPDVGLNLRAGWNGTGLPGPSGSTPSGDWFATVTVAVKGSLFDFGTSAGKVAEAEAAAARAVADADGAELRLGAAAEGAFDDLNTLREEAEYRERIADFRSAKAADAEARRAAGAGTDLAVLQARSDLLSAVLDAAGARMQYTNACVSLLLLAEPDSILSGAAFR